MKRRGEELKREEEEEVENIDWVREIEEEPAPTFKPAKCAHLLVTEIEGVLIRDLAKMVANYAAPESLHEPHCFLPRVPSFPLRFRIDAAGNIDDRRRTDDVHITIEREGGVCGGFTCDCMPDSLWIEVKDEVGEAGRTQLFLEEESAKALHFWNDRWIGELRCGLSWDHPVITMASKFQRIEARHAGVWMLVDALQRREFKSPRSSRQGLDDKFQERMGNVLRLGVIGGSKRAYDTVAYLVATAGFQHEGDYARTRLTKIVTRFEEYEEDDAGSQRLLGKVGTLWDIRIDDDIAKFADYAFPLPPKNAPDYYLTSIAHRMLMDDPETIQHMTAITEAKKQVTLGKARLVKLECRHSNPDWDGTPN